jgi:hypothetical protein
MRRNVTASDGSAEQKTFGNLDFSLVARTAERVGEHFGSFQNYECQQIKASLVKMEERGTGRVLLSDFYKPALGGDWQFQESAQYLRELGALDETEAGKPRVIIANYVSSPSNCIASSSFYSVCCMDECEGLLGHLEQQIAGPEAKPERVAALIAGLSSSSVLAPRKISATLLTRLDEIAAGHGGTVQLHGRLFAQWMHHAFPRECPYPHLSGTTNPQTADEWLEATGAETTATNEEMLAHVEEAETGNAVYVLRAEPKEMEVESMPWSPEEELLVVRPPVLQHSAAIPHSFKCAQFVLIAVGAIAYGMVHNSWTTKRSSAGIYGMSAEKFMV